MVIFGEIHSLCTNPVDMLTSSQLENLVATKCEPALLTPTRIHALPWSNRADGQLYLKREDDSGFGVSGCKKRKYASLLPALQEQGYTQAILIGGSSSNHIPALIQLMRERGIAVKLIRKASHNEHIQGNSFLIRLLIAEADCLVLSGKEWEAREKIGAELCAEWEQKTGQRTALIPEGASCKDAMPGACTLLLDIERNEREAGLEFDHIFIDSGTGLSAGALCLVNHLIGRQTTIHVVLMAGDDTYFQEQLARQREWLSVLTMGAVGLPSTFQTWRPLSGRSFGSVNATVLTSCVHLAREYGILTDPVYTTKLLMTARSVWETSGLSGNTLVVHSGGGTGLMGFARKLHAFF